MYMHMYNLYVCMYLCICVVQIRMCKSFIELNAMLFEVSTVRGVMNSLDGVPADHMHITQLLPAPAVYGI